MSQILDESIQLAGTIEPFSVSSSELANDAAKMELSKVVINDNRSPFEGILYYRSVCW